MQSLLFMIAIIMELRPPSTIEIYTNFQDLHVAVNIHASKEDYAITTKRYKKNKRGELRKVWMQCDKGDLRPKDSEKGKPQQGEMNVLL